MNKNDNMELITSSAILLAIQAVVGFFGKDNLGFEEDKVGTHSNSSSAAMIMYLNSLPVYTIMLVGRWSSEAFLLYIRKQFISFKKVISNIMLLSKEFYTLPDNHTTDNKGPRIPNNQHSFATINYPQPIQYVRVVAPATAVRH